MSDLRRFDFCKGIPPSLAELYGRIERESRDDFVAMIEAVSARSPESLDWWVSNAASRNPYVSSLFKGFCIVRMCGDLLTQHPEERLEVRVPSRGLAKIISGAFPSLSVILTASGRRFQLLRGWIFAVRTVLATLMKRRRSARRSNRQDTRPPDDELILMETFLVQGSFSPEGVFRDRYFGDFIEYLRDELGVPVRVMYEIYGVDDYESLFAQIRGHADVFLVQEDYLRLSDYLYAFMFGLRIPLPSQPVLSNGIDFLPLIREQMNQERFFSISIMALLSYRFIGRLKESGVRIRMFIDWWENQWMDRAAHRAFRDFYPGVKRVGYYGGVVHPDYLCSFATREEKRGDVLPDELAVIGRGWVDPIKRYCPSLNVQVWPAFRFSRIWEMKRKALAGLDVLVALPILREESERLLVMVLDVAGRPDVPVGLRFRIKPHPAEYQWARLRFEAFGDQSTIDLVSGSIYDLMETSAVLLTGWSSTSVEALALGLPVILLGQGDRPEQVPAGVPEFMYKVAHNSETLLKAIRDFSDFAAGGDAAAAFDRAAAGVRAEYFEPVSPETMRTVAKGFPGSNRRA